MRESSHPNELDLLFGCESEVKYIKLNFKNELAVDFMEKTTFVKAKKNIAEKVRRQLLKLSLLDNSFTILSDSSYIYFPLKDQNGIQSLMGDFGGELKTVKKLGVRINRRADDYRYGLGRILTQKELKDFSSGYDAFGNIAVISLPDSLAEKENDIAKIILNSNKNLTTILKKAGPVKGVYRVRPVKYLLGKRTYIADYKENGCRFVFDVRRVFFSTRLAYERNRISNLVSHGETVMVPFAGIGPFAIEIAKKRPDADVVALELNKYGVYYMKKNIEINKANNVEAVLGDFHEASKGYRLMFDRIIMPLPKSSTVFLDDAIAVAKSTAVIHLYAFYEKDRINELKDEIIEHGKANKYKVTFLFERVVRTYSKSMIEVVLDYRIEKQNTVWAMQ